MIADLALRPEAQKLIDDYASQPRAVFVKTNVVIWDELTNMFDVAEKEFGGADIVGQQLHQPLFRYLWLTTPDMPWSRRLRTALEQLLAPPGTAKSKDDPHGTEGVGHYACLDINLTHPIRTTQLAISRWLNPSPHLRPAEPVSATPGESCTSPV